jgi:hypothetical protein
VSGNGSLRNGFRDFFGSTSGRKTAEADVILITDQARGFVCSKDWEVY